MYWKDRTARHLVFWKPWPVTGHIATAFWTKSNKTRTGLDNQEEKKNLPSARRKSGCVMIFGTSRIVNFFCLTRRAWKDFYADMSWSDYKLLVISTNSSEAKTYLLVRCLVLTCIALLLEYPCGSTKTVSVWTNLTSNAAARKIILLLRPLILRDVDPFPIPDKYNFHGDHELPWAQKRCRINQMEQLESFCHKLKFEVCKQMSADKI